MIFREPVRVPIVDRLRETRLRRTLIPNHSTTDIRQGMLQKIDHPLLRLPLPHRLGDVVVLIGRKPAGAAALTSAA